MAILSTPSILTLNPKQKKDLEYEKSFRNGFTVGSWYLTG